MTTNVTLDSLITLAKIYTGGGTNDRADSLGGLVANPNYYSKGQDDAYDAFRHAYTSALLSQVLGEKRSKEIMDKHEYNNPNLPPENNMDRWNNDIGRQEYKRWKEAQEQGLTNDPLDKWIYDRVKRGDTINNPNDPDDNRKWNEPPPGSIPEDEPLPDGDPFTGMPWPNVISSTIGTTPDPLVKKTIYVDPLILDLDGDGLEITPLSENILFDANGDTIKTGTAWAGADDGMLVWDRNGNGLIDSGAELFGDETVLSNGQKAAHGFAALAELDTNADGKFDELDSQYASLRVWRDLNQDGISQANELQSLQASGVKSIDLHSVAAGTKYTDAILAQSGNFTRIDGSTGHAGSFILAQNNFIRAFTPITVSEQARTLPNLGGSGWVRDLQEAATQSPELIGLVNQAKSAGTRVQYEDAVAALLLAWGNNSGYNSASKQALEAGYGLILSDPADAQEAGWMDAAIKASAQDRNAFRNTLSAADLVKFDAMRERMVGGLERVQAYEAFTGYTFLNWMQIKGDALNWIPRPSSSGNGVVPVEVQVPLSQIIYENRNAQLSTQSGYIRVTIPVPSSGTAHVDSLWSRLTSDAIANLMPVLRLAKYADKIDLSITEEGISFDFSGLNSSITSMLTSNTYEGAVLLLDLYSVYGRDFQQLGWNGAEQLVALAQRVVDEPVVAQAFSLVGYQVINGAATVTAATSDIVFSGDSKSNLFQGGSGDDVLDGKEGNDNLNGGAGDDVLIGGVGNDVLNGGLGNDLYIFGLGDGQDTITATYDTTSNKSNILRFRENVAAADVVAKRNGDDLKLSIVGSTDTITVQYFFYGDSTDNVHNPLQEVWFADGTVWSAKELARQTMLGTSSDDQLRGLVSDDVIIGGDGADALYGASGNDVLDGGAGNDYLQGDGGADIYRFGRGGGQDTINNYESVAQGVAKPKDAIVFGANIAPVDIVVTRNWYGDLILSIVGTTDVLTVRGFFQNDAATSYAVDEVRFVDGTVWSVADIKALALVANESGSTLYGFESNDVIEGASGVDIIYGRGGNDTISGQDGNDGLYGEAGNDTLIGGAGRDYLDGGDGDDVLDGGVDDDQLVGGAGADIYRFGRGGGKDTINNYEYIASGQANPVDAIVFGADVTPNDIDARRSSWNELVLTIKGTNDVLTVSQYFQNDGTSSYAVEEVRFADGTVWDIAAIKQRILQPTEGADALTAFSTDDTIYGAGGDDVIQGAGGNDLLDGGEGNDTLYGGEGNDQLLGGNGQDRLYGEAGNDTLLGGTGRDILDGGDGDDVLDGGADDDQLVGGAGADIYRFGRGGGKDTINNYEYIASGQANPVDAIVFGADVTPNDIDARRSPWNELVLTIKGTNDVLTVSQYFQSDGTSSYAVEEVRFADGTVWDIAAIKQRVLQPTEGADALTGFNTDDTIYGAGGDDTLQGVGGNDLLDGGDGNDTLFGGEGADQLLGGNGQDRLYGEAGNDTLLGGSGRDILDGGDGDDVLDGGADDDQLVGGAGADIYRFGRGGGKDTINNHEYIISGQANPVDAIVFGADIAPNDIEARRSPWGDLLLTIKETNDVITVSQYFQTDGSSTYAVEEVRFADGTVWDIAAVKLKVLQPTEGADALTGFSTDDILYGAGGDDTLQGVGGNDLLDGGDGNDTLFGGEGADQLLGGNGQDRLYGEVGNDTLSGGAGQDYLDGGDGDDVLNGGADDDQLIGGAGDDILDGGTGNDILKGGSGNNIYRLSIGGGQDVVVRETFSGGATTDTILVPTSVGLQNVEFIREGLDVVLRIKGTQDSIRVPGILTNDGIFKNYDFSLKSEDGALLSWDGIKLALLHGDAGDNTLTGYATADTMTGGAGNDLIDGAAGNDTISGNEGNDILDGGEGDDILVGGTGDDHYVVDSAGDVLIENAGEGNDTVLSSVKFALSDHFENLTLTGDANIDGVGNAADNILIGNSGSNRLVGGQGNDVLDGGLGTDTLEGGEGDDKYYVGQSSDVIIEAADEGYDTVYASADYTLSANLEKLILDANSYGINGTGNAQANEIIGNSSNNRLDGGSGTDVLIGGDGDDTYVIDSADDQIIETAAGGWDTVESYINYQLTDVLEAVRLLGSADLQAFGNSDGNVLQGNTGNNVLDGGAGADTMSGGEGNDTYYVDQEGDSVIEYANQGTDTIIRSFDTTYILESNVENLILAGTVFRGNGNDLDNVITGNDADNNLLGLGGNDTLIGGGGNDALFGSEGQDILIGGTGDDYYEVDDAGDVIIEYGGEGDDFVRSSVSWTLGANVERLALDGTANLSATGNSLDNGLWGNSGNNVLTGGLGSDFLSGGAGNDIYVFNAGDGQDTIDNTDVVGALDTLRFGAGIAESDVLAFKYGDSLFLKIRGTTDQVAISNYFAASTTSNGVSSDRKIDRVEFANGASWDQAMIQTVVDRAINDQAPTINSGLPTLKATQGSAFTYVVPVGTITDPDPWDSVTYSAKMANGAPLPSWLTFDPQSRTFSGRPTAGDVGSFQFVLWGTDNYGKSTGTYVNFSVASPNRAPVVSTPIADQTATAGSAFSYTVAAGTFTDPDAGDSLSYVATLANGSALPSWLVFNASTRKFTGTAPAGTAQSLSIKVVATDSGGLSVQDVFDINVVVAGQTLNGTASADTLTGGAGDDTIDGKGGNDTLIGNAGNDRLIGGTGNDTMRGGTGNDTYVVDATGDIVTELANEGIDTVESSITYTLGSNVENLVLTGTAALNGTGNSLANTLTGNSGANTLQGGGGNDTLIGGAGNDLYLFNVGDGQDTIDTQDILSAVDVLRFGTGITSSNVSLARTGDDLVLKINNSSDQVTIAGYFTANTTTGGVTQNRKIDRIEFASGTPWSQADIDAAFNPPAQNHAPEVASYLPTLNATSGQAFTYTVAAGVITDPDPGDTITYSATLADGSALPSWLSFNSSTRTFTGTPQAGNIGNLQFVLWGSDGHGQSVGMYVTLNVASDQPSAFSPSHNFDYVIPDGTSGVTISGNAPYNIKGNSANNSITGNTGANVIYGAGGNDTLTGGTGNDTYLLGRGDGKDVIVENDSTAGNTDVAQFATDIAADQLWFRQVGNNLEVSVIGTSDQFTVNNWYLGNQYHVEQFKSGNGKVLLDSKVQNLVQAMASFSPPAAGQTTLPANYQSSLSGVIAANWQ